LHPLNVLPGLAYTTGAVFLFLILPLIALSVVTASVTRIFIIFFAISQGSVIWVYIAEVFPSRVRSKGQSLGSSSHWIMNAIISLVFPIMAKASGGTPFAFFAAMMALQFFVVLFIYPETKGISLEQLQAKLGIR